MIKRAFAIIACAVGWCGCASSNGFHHLTFHQSMMLLAAVNGWVTAGGDMPEPVQKLNPVQVYDDHGNVVIALHRDAHGEEGYYVIPSTSSYDPHFRLDPGWTYKPLKYFDPNFDDIYEYSRTF